MVLRGLGLVEQQLCDGQHEYGNGIVFTAAMAWKDTKSHYFQHCIFSVLSKCKCHIFV